MKIYRYSFLLSIKKQIKASECNSAEEVFCHDLTYNVENKKKENLLLFGNFILPYNMRLVECVEH